MCLKGAGSRDTFLLGARQACNPGANKGTDKDTHKAVNAGAVRRQGAESIDAHQSPDCPNGGANSGPNHAGANSDSDDTSTNAEPNSGANSNAASEAAAAFPATASAADTGTALSVSSGILARRQRRFDWQCLQTIVRG